MRLVSATSNLPFAGIIAATVLTTSATMMGCSEQGLYDLPEADETSTEDGAPGDGNNGQVYNGPVGAINGQVCGPDGSSWIAGATVWATTAAGRVETTTDIDGRFELQGLAPGNTDLHIEKGSFTTVTNVEVIANQSTSLPAAECVEQGDVRIAVISGQYDTIEDILDYLAIDYDVVDGRTGNASVNFLRDEGAYDYYDVIFFNCGFSDAWLQHDAEISAKLYDFVNNGGSVYASDWAYYVVENTFPDANLFHGDDGQPDSAHVGDEQTLQATVLDLNMQILLGGASAQINYDLGIWTAMVAPGPATDVLISGDYSYNGNQSRVGPLATRFHVGDGTVIFTTFHNEQQTTIDMDLLLQDIVLSL